MDELVERLRAIDSMEEAWLAIEEAADRIEKLEAAGQAILDRMSGTLSNGNGVEAADGEKCWIVHSDEIEALRATITSSAR